jgi:hypothetical protein
MFHTSDKIVCVDDSAGQVTGEKPLVNGRVYVVRESYTRPTDGRSAVFLIGIAGRFPWASERFRKLEELKAESANRAHDHVLLNTEQSERQ